MLFRSGVWTPTTWGGFLGWGGWGQTDNSAVSTSTAATETTTAWTYATIPPPMTFDDGSGPAWYRAKVLEVDKDTKTYKIKFLDFGNVDYGATAKTLAPLDAGYAALPYAALEVGIAHAQAPSLEDDYGEDAAKMVHELCWGKDLKVTEVHVYKAEKTMAEIAFADDADGLSLNELLVQAGLALL